MAAMNEKICELKHPFLSQKGEMVNQIRLRHFKVGDIRKIGKKTSDNLDAVLMLLADINDLTLEDMDEIYLSDMTRISEEIEPFLEGMDGITQSF